MDTQIKIAWMDPFVEVDTWVREDVDTKYKKSAESLQTVCCAGLDPASSIPKICLVKQESQVDS